MSRVACSLLTAQQPPNMLSKFMASWLVVLVVAPFTAPFPTCDFDLLFNGGSPQQTQCVAMTRTAPLKAIAPTPDNEPGGSAGLPTLSHDAAVPCLPSLVRAARVKFLTLSHLAATGLTIVAPAKSSSSPHDTADAFDLCATQPIVLRL
jgi:hypothetical protein